ncbi:MAG: carbon-nitrogen hydrolase family protein [Kiritimatiellae bacterium]|nr:carbon-nitrogen hydrolase family protein [Kiritimatiellia bacterium]
MVLRNALTVSVVQNSAGTDGRANLRRIERLVAQAPRSDLYALPEVFSMRGHDRDYRDAAQPLGRHDVLGALRQMATARRAWVLAGSVIEKRRNGVFNTSVLLAPDGRIASAYRKIHLFEARLDDGRIIREKDAYSPGREPVLAHIGNWVCGLAVCYDLRFPELFRHYVGKGAQLLMIPSNFTQRTGRDHWEVLVRARAVENQCFVVAPNQCGVNPRTGVASYGHSLIVGPWGEILAEAGKRPTVVSATLDRARLRQVRRRIPALKHRRLG